MIDRQKIWLGRGFLALGVGLLVLWLGAGLDGLAYRFSLSPHLEFLGRLRGTKSLVRAAVASRREAKSTGLIGRLEIPRVDLTALVVEGTSGRALRRGVGHVKGTPFPGERGNVALAGHRDTYLRKLKDVEKGDLIRIATPDGVFAYQVETIMIVRPYRADLLDNTRRPRLTLVTCYPFHWIGPAPKRFVIRARPVDGPLAVEDKAGGKAGSSGGRTAAIAGGRAAAKAGS